MTKKRRRPERSKNGALTSREQALVTMIYDEKLNLSTVSAAKVLKMNVSTAFNILAKPRVKEYIDKVCQKPTQTPMESGLTLAAAPGPSPEEMRDGTLRRLYQFVNMPVNPFDSFRWHIGAADTLLKHTAPTGNPPPTVPGVTNVFRVDVNTGLSPHGENRAYIPKVERERRGIRDPHSEAIERELGGVSYEYGSFSAPTPVDGGAVIEGVPVETEDQGSDSSS